MKIFDLQFFTQIDLRDIFRSDVLNLYQPFWPLKSKSYKIMSIHEFKTTSTTSVLIFTHTYLCVCVYWFENCNTFVIPNFYLKYRPTFLEAADTCDSIWYACPSGSGSGSMILLRFLGSVRLSQKQKLPF